MKQRSLFLVGLYVLSMLGFALGVLAQNDGNCPGAPQPRLVVNERGRVTPGDANNLRETPDTTSAKVGEIPGGEPFSVLQGPVCSDGFNWWQVSYGALTGWTVEGQGNVYWVEPLIVIETPAAPWSNAYRNPQHLVANVLAAGVAARVQTMDGSSLPVYAARGDAAPAEHLPSGTLVTLVEEGPEGWWRVESEEGVTGWTREAVERTETPARMSPTLAPLCPYTEDRVLFIGSDRALGDNLYSVGLDGSHLCNLSYGLQKDFGVFDWSPDGQWIAYAAAVERGSPGYFGYLDLYVQSVDGRILRRLTFNQHVNLVEWSPDGAWIVVYMDGEVSGTRAIRLIAPDGSSERTVWNSDQAFRAMRVSPDGSQVAIIEQPYEGTRSSVLVIDGTTGDGRTVFSSRWQTSGLDWSPDGAFLVVSARLAGAEPALIEIDVANATYEELVPAGTVSASYSPDGMRIAYWHIVNASPRVVSAFDRATGEVHSLASIPGVNRPGLSWMPAGDALLVTAGGVMRVDASSGALRSIFVGGNGSSASPLAQPTGQ